MELSPSLGRLRGYKDSIRACELAGFDFASSMADCTSRSTAEKVCIIGGGVSGLVTLRTLLAEGFDVTLYGIVSRSSSVEFLSIAGLKHGVGSVGSGLRVTSVKG